MKIYTLLLLLFSLSIIANPSEISAEPTFDESWSWLSKKLYEGRQTKKEWRDEFWEGHRMAREDSLVTGNPIRTSRKNHYYSSIPSFKLAKPGQKDECILKFKEYEWDGRYFEVADIEIPLYEINKIRIYNPDIERRDIIFETSQKIKLKNQKNTYIKRNSRDRDIYSRSVEKPRDRTTRDYWLRLYNEDWDMGSMPYRIKRAAEHLVKLCKPYKPKSNEPF